VKAVDPQLYLEYEGPNDENKKADDDPHGKEGGNEHWGKLAVVILKA